jgi:hypothetical protein
MFGSEREARGHTNYDQTRQRRSFHITVEGVNGREHETRQANISSDYRSMRQQIGFKNK